MAGLLGPKGRKLALAVHLLFVALWFGAAIAMVLLVFAQPRGLKDDLELIAYCRCVKLIDDYIIIASAGGTLLSGAFLAWRTKWGFFVWYWIAFKLIATLAMVAFGATCLGPWINMRYEIARSSGIEALHDAAFQLATDRVQFWGTLQILLLAAVVVISIFKPWGKIPSRNV